MSPLTCPVTSGDLLSPAWPLCHLPPPSFLGGHCGRPTAQLSTPLLLPAWGTPPSSRGCGVLAPLSSVRIKHPPPGLRPVLGPGGQYHHSSDLFQGHELQCLGA